MNGEKCRDRCREINNQLTDCIRRCDETSKLQENIDHCKLLSDKRCNLLSNEIKNLGESYVNIIGIINKKGPELIKRNEYIIGIIDDNINKCKKLNDPKLQSKDKHDYTNKINSLICQSEYVVQDIKRCMTQCEILSQNQTFIKERGLLIGLINISIKIYSVNNYHKNSNDLINLIKLCMLTSDENINKIKICIKRYSFIKLNEGNKTFNKRNETQNRDVSLKMSCNCIANLLNMNVTDGDIVFKNAPNHIQSKDINIKLLKLCIKIREKIFSYGQTYIDRKEELLKIIKSIFDSDKNEIKTLSKYLLVGESIIDKLRLCMVLKIRHTAAEYMCIQMILERLYLIKRKDNQSIRIRERILLDDTIKYWRWLVVYDKEKSLKKNKKQINTTEKDLEVIVK